MPNLGGRPTKKTDDLVNKLIGAFHDDATIEQACYIAGITKPTYYDWLKQDESFSYEMEKAQEYPKWLAKNTILKAIKDGDAKTAMDFIKRREKERYSERNEYTGADGKELTPLLVKFINDKEDRDPS